MAKKRKTKQVIIFSLILIGLFVALYSGVLQEAFQPEVGWIPYEGATDSFTNPNLNVMNYNVNNLWSRFTSKYWTIEEVGLFAGVNPNDYDYNSLFADTITTGYVSGELDMYVFERPNSAGPIKYIKFNDNLAGKHFKINYRTYEGGSIKFDRYSDKTYTGSGVIEFKPSALEDKSFVYINGELVKEIDTSSGALYFEAGEENNPYSGAGFMSQIVRFYNPRYKPLFSCIIDNDEVVVADTFAPGTTFNIEDLTYPVKKFCVDDYPAVVRSFTELGSTSASSFEILQKISEGGKITVKDDQTIYVQYITKDQTGLQRCSAGEAWDVEKSECVNVLGEGEIPDVEPEVQQEFVIIGSGEFTDAQNYKDTSFMLGDNLVISSEKPIYTCSCPLNDGYVSPSSKVDDSCFKTSINNKEVVHNGNVAINNYVNVDYIFSGKVYCGEKDGNYYNGEFVKDEDWTNNLIININPDGLAITPSDNIGVVPLGDDYELSFFVDNKIASFTDGGFRIQTTKNILQQITEVNVISPISSGVKEYTINLDTSKLGEVEAKITPYVVVDGRKVYGSSTLNVQYIVKENPSPEEIVSSKVEPTVEETKASSWSMFGIVAFGIIVLVLLFLIIRKLIQRRRR